MEFPDGATIRQIAFAYPFEEDAPFFRDRPGWTSSGRMSLDDVYQVIDWKARRVKEQFKKANESRDIPSLTQKALSPFLDLGPGDMDYSRILASLKILGTMKFVRVRMASAILTIFRPQLFTVLDWRAWSVLAAYEAQGFERGANLDKPNNYLHYLKECHRLSESRGVSLRNLDRCLWLLGGTKSKTHGPFLEARRSALSDNGW